MILYRERLTGGTAFTKLEAVRLGRPHLVMDLAEHHRLEAITTIREWLGSLSGSRLNVAGPRASTDPTAYALAEALLRELLATRP